jgi:hypothetical protein
MVYFEYIYFNIKITMGSLSSVNDQMKDVCRYFVVIFVASLVANDLPSRMIQNDFR